MTHSPHVPPRIRWVPSPFQALLAVLLVSIIAVTAWGYAYARNRMAAFRYVTSRGGDIATERPEWCPAVKISA